MNKGILAASRALAHFSLGSRNPAVVGSAEEVADDPISWVQEPVIDFSVIGYLQKCARVELPVTAG